MISKQERVQRGAALLDKTMPGWARKIKLRRLNMEIGHFSTEDTDCGCIGAQLDATQGQEGSWVNTMLHLKLVSSDDDLLEARHGFVEYPNETHGFFLLGELWKDEVRTRR